MFVQVKKQAVGAKHAEYAQSLVALAEMKHVQGKASDAVLLFQEAAQVLLNQDPSFSAGVFFVGSPHSQTILP